MQRFSIALSYKHKFCFNEGRHPYSSNFESSSSDLNKYHVLTRSTKMQLVAPLSKVVQIKAIFFFLQRNAHLASVIIMQDFLHSFSFQVKCLLVSVRKIHVFTKRDGTSLLTGKQRGLLKILQCLMNMDFQLPVVNASQI